MDPKQTILEMLRAIIAGDKERAAELFDAWNQWRGPLRGFDPTLRGSEIVSELSNYF